MGLVSTRLCLKPSLINLDFTKVAVEEMALIIGDNIYGLSPWQHGSRNRSGNLGDFSLFHVTKKL